MRTWTVTSKDGDGGFEAARGAHAVPWRGSLDQRADRVLRARSSSAGFEPARHLFVPIARFALKPGEGPGRTWSRLSPTRLQVELTAETYLAFVHLISARPDVRFTDNHFDLAAGDRRIVIAMGERAIGPGDLTIRCWNDGAAPEAP